MNGAYERRLYKLFFSFTMLITNEQIVQDERERRFRSTMMWRTKLFRGVWNEFILDTDSRQTKSSKLASRLEMLRNCAEFGIASLALKIFSEKQKVINEPVMMTPAQIRNLEVVKSCMDCHENDQFLISLFGNAAHVLAEDIFSDKGEHYFYLVNSNASQEDIEDFIQTRIINDNVTMFDITSIVQFLEWYPNENLERHVTNAWFQYMQRSEKTIDEKIVKSFDELREKVHHVPDIIERLKASDDNELNSIYFDLRKSVDYFSYAINRNSIGPKYMDLIQNYAYEKAISNGRLQEYRTKKDFMSEEAGEKRKILNGLYSGLSYNIIGNLKRNESPF